MFCNASLTNEPVSAVRFGCHVELKCSDVFGITRMNERKTNVCYVIGNQ